MFEPSTEQVILCLESLRSYGRAHRWFYWMRVPRLLLQAAGAPIYVKWRLSDACNPTSIRKVETWRKWVRRATLLDGPTIERALYFSIFSPRLYAGDQCIQMDLSALCGRFAGRDTDRGLAWLIGSGACLPQYMGTERYMLMLNAAIDRLRVGGASHVAYLMCHHEKVIVDHLGISDTRNVVSGLAVDSVLRPDPAVPAELRMLTSVRPKAGIAIIPGTSALVPFAALCSHLDIPLLAGVSTEGSEVASGEACFSVNRELLRIAAQLDPKIVQFEG